MNTWKLEAGRCITTPDGTFSLTYGRTTDGSNAPLFRDFCKLDEIARQVAVLPELIRALGIAIECMRTTEETGDDGESDACIKECADVLRKVQP
jgi:hypothetical protein